MENNKIENYLFTKEKRFLRHVKKGDYTKEEIITEYEELLDQSKLISRVSKSLNNKMVEIIEDKDLKITELENKLHKTAKLGVSTGILLVLAGFVIAGIGIFLM